MTGEWERKSCIVWTYRLAGAPRPYGYVVRYQDVARSDADWDAIVMVGRVDERPIAERVSFDEAKATLTQHAHLHADW